LLAITDVIASLLIDLHPSKAKLTLLHHGNCFLIASIVNEFSLWQMGLRVEADGTTRSLCDALYHHQNYRFDMLFDGI
jgi:hypothetical protein